MLQRCFKKTKELFKTRNCYNDWADNIIEGGRILNPTNGRLWKHFYCWLANPTGYNEEEVEGLEIDNTLKEIPPYPDCMEVREYKNGTETEIRVTNKLFNKSIPEDEKIDD